MNIKEIIDKAREHIEIEQVGMYGLGVWGRGFAWRLFSYLNVYIDFVSDRDVEKLNEFERENIRKITADELLSIKTKTIVFVMIGQYYLRDVMNLLSKNPALILVTLDEILDLDCVLESFYGIENIRKFEKKAVLQTGIKNRISNFKKEGKIAVYTCIINNYDELREPCVVEENCDYFLISDKKPSDLRVFQWIDYRTVVPEEYKDPAVINRYCKMHAHEIFSDYRYSIYMDGKVQILRAIGNYIDCVGNIGLGVHKHHVLNCIYSEGIRMVGVGTSNESNVVTQMRGYLLEGMPRNFGTFECRVVVRDHSVVLGNQIMKQWFDEYYKKERRDQFSLSYIIWKNGLTCDDVGLLNGGLPWPDNKDIDCRTKHLTDSVERNVC